jgi:hypothetical protein
MLMVARRVCLLSAVTWAALVLSSASLLRAQAPYAGLIPMDRGQDVTPAFEGWMPNADGTISMYFGYLNRNFKEELDIPIGPENNIDPGGDRGQPTHFYPRRQRFVFTVTVPKDWPADKKIVWTLTIRGKTNIAKGWLQREWEIDKEVMQQQTGGGNDQQNEPPVFTTNTGPQTVTLPQTVNLTATAQDDGRPRPRRVRDIEDVGDAAPTGLSVRWIQYRGPSPVMFNPQTAAVGYGKPITATTTASFKTPGTYVLRAIASDGSLMSFQDVTVTVK